MCQHFSHNISVLSHQLLDCISCCLPTPHNCWERAYFEVCKVHKKKKKAPLMLVLYKLHSRSQLPVISLDNLSISQTASWGSLGHVMCFALLQSKINPEDCHWFWSQGHAVFTCDFCFLWEALERKVKNKMLTADTKQCLPSASVSIRAEAL